MWISKNIGEQPHTYKKRVRLGPEMVSEMLDSAASSHWFRKMSLCPLPTIRHRIPPPSCLYHRKLSCMVQQATFSLTKGLWRRVSSSYKQTHVTSDFLCSTKETQHQRPRAFMISLRVSSFTEIQSMLKAHYKIPCKQTNKKHFGQASSHKQ